MLSFILRNKLKTICINYFVKFSLYLGRMFLLSKYNHIVYKTKKLSLFEMMLTIYTTNILSIFIYNVSISVNTMNTA